MRVARIDFPVWIAPAAGQCRLWARDEIFVAAGVVLEWDAPFDDEFPGVVVSPRLLERIPLMPVPIQPPAEFSFVMIDFGTDESEFEGHFAAVGEGDLCAGMDLLMSRACYDVISPPRRLSPPPPSTGARALVELLRAASASGIEWAS